MLWTHLGGAASQRGEADVMSGFFHWSACSPPTLRRATDHHHGQQSSAPEGHKKKIQIHTLKYENAVEKKHNANARLKKFKSADDDDASVRFY